MNTPNKSTNVTSENAATPSFEDAVRQAGARQREEIVPAPAEQLSREEQMLRLLTRFVVAHERLADSMEEIAGFMRDEEERKRSTSM